MPSDEALPRLVIGREDEGLSHLLREGRRLLSQRPDAYGPMLRGLVAEGRRFAETPEGTRWQERLAESPLIRQGRLVWQAAGLDAFLTEEPGVLPSEWVAMAVALLQSSDLEAIFGTFLAGER